MTIIRTTKRVHHLGCSLLALLLALPALANDPVWDANAVELRSKQLALGVFAVFEDGGQEKSAQGLPLATSGGFVIEES